MREKSGAARKMPKTTYPAFWAPDAMTAWQVEWQFAQGLPAASHAW